MAITRQAKNYMVRADSKYKASIGGKFIKSSDKMIIDAISGNLNIGSNRKVVNNGAV